MLNSLIDANTPLLQEESSFDTLRIEPGTIAEVLISRFILLNSVYDEIRRIPFIGLWNSLYYCKLFGVFAKN